MSRPFKYQRQIVDLLEKNPIHPTVEWIHAKLRDGNPKIGLATIYRTLRELVKEGVICELPFGTGEARFGLSRIEKHYHFICDSCRKVYDISVRPNIGLEMAVQDSTGHKVKRHTVEFYGLCKKCSARIPPEDPGGKGNKGDGGTDKKTATGKKE